MNDGTLIGDTTEVAKALQILQEEGPSRGLCLDIRKLKFSGRTHILDVMMFSHLKSADHLVVSVYLEDQFCSESILSRVTKTIHLMDCVQKLRDPQRELLLLRNCAGVSKLYFTMRITRPQVMQYAQLQFDEHLLQFLRYLITSDGASFGQLQQRIATLPIKYVGLGIYTMGDTIQYGYMASCF